MRDYTARDANIRPFDIAYNLYVVARAHSSDNYDGAEMLAHALSLCEVNPMDDDSKAWNLLCAAIEAAKKWVEEDNKSEEAPDAK